MPRPNQEAWKHSLLDDPLLGVEDDKGSREVVTLPALLAGLSGGKSLSLTALQAHQQHAMHAFLVQLAAIALSRSKRSEPPKDEPTWRTLLKQAAAKDGAGPEAFALVVSDLRKPAFLQPPVPEGKLGALKNRHTLPADELDVLITSKNMDVKMGRLGDPVVEHWIYALVALQTTQGFLGAGNYGIARMNGGFASRPCVAFAPGFDAGVRFNRDLHRLLEVREQLVRDHGFAKRGELGLVWCAPWDGTKSLSIAELDPFFIEICRRVRLASDDSGAIQAHRGSSKAARIAAKDLNGNTGDPWTPVNRKDGKALTMSEAGFHYERVHELLFGSWRAGAAGEAERGDQLWVGQVLVRGQGKTGGFHERWVPIPPKARRFFARPEDRERLGRRSEEWVGKAGTARQKVLKPALLTLIQGAPEKLKFDDIRGGFHLRGLDAAIDEVFFPMLFEHADEGPEQAGAAFERALVDLARAQLNDAIAGLPVPSARRWRAEAHAHRVLEGAARNNFKLAFPPKETEPADMPATTGDTP